MAFIDSPRVKQLIQQISDETISIADFLAASMEQNSAIKEKVKPVLNALIREGIDVNEPWASLANEDEVNRLLESPHTTSSTFQNLQAIEKETNIFYNKNRKAIENPVKYPFSDGSVRITGSGGLARSFGNKTDNPKAYQVRGTKKFKKVPRADITIPKLFKAINKIENKTTRAALAFNILVPFRPGEVANLRIDEIDFEEGYIEEYTRGNKTRPGIKLPKVALEILRDAAESDEAKKTGRIFPNMTTNKMTTALKTEGNIVDLFKGNKAVLGRAIEGVKDLRKLIPSLLAQELGADAKAVSQIMGHEDIGSVLADINKMSTGHYVSPVDLDEDAASNALDRLERMVGKNAGVSTLNDIPIAFNVDAKNLTSETAEILNIPFDIEENITVTKELTPEQLELRNKQIQLNTLQTQENISDTEIRIAEKEIEKLEKQEKARKARLASVSRDPNEQMEEVLAKDTQKIKVQNALKQELINLSEIPEDELTPDQLQKKQIIEKRLQGVLPVEEVEEPKDWANSKVDDPIERRKTLLKSLRNVGKITKPLKSIITGAVVGGATSGASTIAEAALQVIEPSPIGGVAEDTPVEDIPSSELLRSMESGERIGTTGKFMNLEPELNTRLAAQEQQKEIFEGAKGRVPDRLRRFTAAREREQGYYSADPELDVSLTQSDIDRAKQSGLKVKEKFLEEYQGFIPQTN
jgi:integrase|tara:strand:+ start:17 stop:2107 length:2091 start_codon:yes stop_codon:yes gene_type:complete